MKCMESCVLVLSLAIAAAAPGHAQTPPTTTPNTPARLPIPATPGKTFDLAWVGKMVRVSDPQIAPDGNSLVAVVTRLDYENNLNVAELALVDIASGKTRPLTHGRKTASFPRWSPSGDRIAFLAADAEKHNQIFAMEMDGGEPRNSSFLDRTVCQRLSAC
jgi:dipeptidyl aminopeptidase/acylaminoacyl peptidase